MPPGDRLHENHCGNKELQRGLVPEEKRKRVAAYAKAVAYGVGVIAHSCGVVEPRGLERKHMRVIEAGGASHNMADLHPLPETRDDYATGAQQ